MSPRGDGRLADGSVSEASFQGAVLGLARFYGWREYHPPDNTPTRDHRGRAGRQRVVPGFPDVTLVRGPELLFAELKAERGVVSAAQREWIEALSVVAGAVAAAVRESTAAQELGYLEAIPAVEVYLWRPSDWDAIEERLSRGRARQPMPAPQ